MTPPIRGSWQIDSGIRKRWQDAGLDAVFRKEWRNPNATDYRVLHDTEANPAPPGPYCVYEIGDIQPIANMTGPEVHSEHQLQNVPVQFRIHAIGSTRESAKSKAIRLAKEVAAAFDDEKLDFDYDKHVRNDKMPDFGVREGDEEYSWVLPYEWLIDAVIRRTVRKSHEI